MRFGIKSWLAVLVLFGLFIASLIQDDNGTFLWTLFGSHLLSPAFWCANYYCARRESERFFFQGALIAGIAPWIASVWLFIVTNIFISSSPLTYSSDYRLRSLAIWFLSGIIAICGGLLSYWIYRCSAPKEQSAVVENGAMTSAAEVSHSNQER